MIVTPDQRLRVFVSSTLDLTDERTAVRRAIEALNLTPVMFEAGARAHHPRSLYRAYVEQSEVFVAVYARRYGWVAPGMAVSGLEDEFDLSAGKPRLVYIEANVEREPKLNVFLERVRDAGLSYKPFTTPAELESLVKDDLVVLLTERFHASGSAHAHERRPAPLPSVPTPLFGRDDELAAIADRLGGPDVRLVTLLGPGGIGKTRLAIEAARRAAGDFPGGVFFVSLEALREPRLIGDEIASALGVSRSDAYPALAAVQDFVGDRPVLLVLDNFEQVIAGASAVAELLSACPRLRVIVTSRSPLRIRGEHEVDVPPLPASSRGSAAVQLFVEHARAVRPSFELDDDSAAAVVELCDYLDGLPLAIELAASMVRLMDPPAILDRIRSGALELAGGPRDLPERHHRLADTIGWSYELLDPAAQRLFAQLSVFRGGFTLETAGRVCNVDGDLFAGVSLLTEHSLLRTRVHPRVGVRFSMLGTIRAFAARVLDEDPRREAVLAAYAQTFIGLAEKVGGPAGRRPAVLDEVEAELDNVRAAFDLAAVREPERVATAVSESWWFWWIRGYVAEGRLWAERCLAELEPASHPWARARAAEGMLAIWSGAYDVAVPALREAAEAAQAHGDDRIRAWADIGTGIVESITGRTVEGTTAIRRGAATLERLGEHSYATIGLAALCWVQGVTREFDEGPECFERTLARGRADDSVMEMGIAEAALAQYEMTHGRGERAPGLLRDALQHVAGVRHVGLSILTLEVVAELGIRAGFFRESTSLLAATAAIRSSMGTSVPPAAAARLEELLGRGRDHLGAQFDDAFENASGDFDTAVAEGAALLDALVRGPGS